MTKSNYTPGIQTREKILSSAKKLFYENSFAKTSLQDIARDAGLRQSLLYYYFDDKYAIAREIFLDFNIRHDGMILDELKRRNISISKTVERSLYVASYFRLYMNNPKMARFISDLADIDLQYKDSFTYDAYKAIIYDNPECLKETPFEFIVLQNIAINVMIFRLFTTKQLESSIEEIVRFKVVHLLRSLLIDKERINSLLEEIFKLESELQFDLIDFFELKLRDNNNQHV